MPAIAVIGGTGFVGGHLVERLRRGSREIRMLVRDPRAARVPAGVAAITGELADPAAVGRLAAPGSTLINFAHPAEGDARSAMKALVGVCAANGVKRIVHCSTAVVAGDVPDDVVTEETACRPASAYEKAKYAIELVMREAAAGRVELAILRPTVVFGPGGRNLMSQVRRIARRGVLANVLYAALQGDRRMNLVSVHNVVAAADFLAAAERVDQQSYIVSDDAHPSNNYRDVARILGRELGRGRVVSDFALPPAFLRASLKARGRTNLNPRRVYADDKLTAAGFAKPWDFEAALVELARSVK
jgi:nucleoside-diphosphate-sugar epimerase